MVDPSSCCMPRFESRLPFLPWWQNSGRGRPRKTWLNRFGFLSCCEPPQPCGTPKRGAFFWSYAASVASPLRGTIGRAATTIAAPLAAPPRVVTASSSLRSTSALLVLAPRKPEIEKGLRDAWTASNGDLPVLPRPGRAPRQGFSPVGQRPCHRPCRCWLSDCLAISW